jgi:ABC-2 type transport system ATP-binding protein
LPVLQVTNLHKSYGDIRAVDGISFAIDAGEIFGLLGPNGAGKSTTINVIAALLEPDEGQVVIDGTPRSHAAAYKRRIGYIPQELSLVEQLTARENLMLLGRLYDLSGADLRRRVAEALDMVGLPDRADDLIKTYSGGMKRRLNIAAALMHQPALILMDEPTIGVDPQARAYIFDVIERLAGEGRAILYTTHYMEEAQRLCRRTAIIDHGRILACGTLAELVAGIKARRDLVLEAEQLSPQTVSALAAKLGNVPWRIENGSAHFTVGESACGLIELVRAVDDAKIRVKAIRVQEPDLETVFLELTGRALRE